MNVLPVSKTTPYLTVRYMRWGFGLFAALLILFGFAFGAVSWQKQKAEELDRLTSLTGLGSRLLAAYWGQYESALSVLGQHFLDDPASLDPENATTALGRFLLAYSAVRHIRLEDAKGSPIAKAGTDSSIARYLVSSQMLESDNGTVTPGISFVSTPEPDAFCCVALRYPIENRKGEINFYLHAVLRLSDVHGPWHKLALSDDTAVGLIDDNGYLLSRYPAPVSGKPDGSNYEASGIRPIKFLQQARFLQNGTTETMVGADSKDKVLISFHRLEKPALHFFASTPVSHLQTAWWRSTQYSYLLIAVLLTGCLIIFRWTIKRQIIWEGEREKEEHRYRLAAHAMENTIDGIMIIDANKRIVSVNKGFSRITGYLADEVIGHVPRMLQSPHHGDDFYKQLWTKLTTDGSWKGEIWDRRKSGEKYVQSLSLSAALKQGKDVTHYVGTFNDISQYKDYESCLEFLANHDALTNLPNRILLNNRLADALQKAEKDREQVCVMFIDLDRFKFINDSLGHDVGDRLLQQVAARLLANVPATATVARLGGDEFTILLDGLKQVIDAAAIAEKLLAALLKPVDIDAHQLYISASIGISVYPQDGGDTATLLKHADIAMYRAKEEGKGKFKFFSNDMNARAREFMMMANSLHSALERHELVIEYQPRVNLASGKIVGAEALTRWNHPTLGRISPEKFIPLAEETGLIVPIGEWIIDVACRQGREWLDAGYPLQIAVNLSVRQFRKPGLVKYICDTAASAGFPLHLLEVEITESLMMNDPQIIKEALIELRRRGVKIAIDDFGTGYSSLSYLKQYPIGYVKIDKSFVKDTPRDADSVAIVRTIIAMAKSLRLALIAEGVETVEQRDLLHAEGCDEAQGYYFSRSLPASDIPPLLAKLGCVAKPGQQG